MKTNVRIIIKAVSIMLCVALLCTACSTKSEEQFVSPESDGIVGILDRPELSNDMLTNNFVMVYDGYLLQLTPEEYSFILSGGEAQIRDVNPDWDRMDALAYKFGPYTIENNIIIEDPFAPKSDYTFPLSHEATAASSAYKYPVSADELNDMMSVYDWNWKADKDAYGANSHQGLVAGEPDVMFFTEIVPIVNDKIGLGFANMHCYSGSELSDGSDERDLSINLAIQPFAATAEQLQTFCETDVPAVYALSGKLIGDTDSVALMENMVQEILPGLKYDGINTISFLSHNNNAYCQSDYMWNETIGEYIFTSFTITKSEKHLARDMRTFSSHFPFYDWTDTVCTIQEMTTQASDEGKFLAAGTLVDIRPIDQDVYYSLANKGLVAGTAYEATLADDTGEVKVLVLPNVLSEEELSMELLHMVSCRTEDGTPVFTIEKSALPEAQLLL